MSFSNYLENKVLDHVFKTTAFTQPSNIYVALSTADPGEDGSTIAEPSGGSYARVQCNTWDAASGGAIANTSAITFAQATASWGTITHVGLFDASTAGNFLGSKDLTASKAIGIGDTFEIAAGDFDVTLD